MVADIARAVQVVVFVGYMRRYAVAFLRMKEEIATLKTIHYATVRDIIGEVCRKRRTRYCTFVWAAFCFPAATYPRADANGSALAEFLLRE